MSVANLTHQERLEAWEKAKESRIKKKEYAEKNLKLRWDDENHWRDLSAKYGFRLANRYEKAGSKFVNRLLKHLGIDGKFYSDVTGYSNGNAEARANVNMPAFAQQGFLLEAYDEQQENVK